MIAKIDPAAAQPSGVPTPLNCPRCDSANTKFCYYNNYSLSQPRHFCKSCKRYWTRGGTLRNVPVGGGSRKNKRAKKHTRSAVTSAAPPPSQFPPIHLTTTDFNSLFYNLPAINSSTKFDLDALHLAGYDGKYFPPCLPAGNLLDLQKSTPSPKIFLGDYPSAAVSADVYQPLISFDEFPIETHEINESFAVSGAAAADSSSYLYWNQPVSGGWPESGSSSMAPLI